MTSQFSSRSTPPPPHTPPNRGDPLDRRYRARRRHRRRRAHPSDPLSLAQRILYTLARAHTHTRTRTHARTTAPSRVIYWPPPAQRTRVYIQYTPLSSCIYRKRRRCETFNIFYRERLPAHGNLGGRADLLHCNNDDDDDDDVLARALLLLHIFEKLHYS